MIMTRTKLKTLDRHLHPVKSSRDLRQRRGTHGNVILQDAAEQQAPFERAVNDILIEY